MNRITIATTILLSIGLSATVSPAYSTTANDTASVMTLEICNSVSDNQIISDPSGIMETCCSEQLGYCIICDPLSGAGCKATNYSNRININFGRSRVLPNAGRTFISHTKGPSIGLQTQK